MTEDDRLCRGSDLLSRYAESTMWLARYLERIENLARVLDVTETFVRTGQGHDGWSAVVQINADEAQFHAMHDKATAASVVSFYLIEPRNQNSIANIVHMARENARTLRPLISTEMWSHINVFYNWVRLLGENDIRAPLLSALCARLKQECQTHYGITEGTFYRDQGWYFYRIGKYLERADQITRLVDIKYHTLLPEAAGIGSEVDVSQWSAVLRAAAAYHAYRRNMPRRLQAHSVAGFLLLNDAFPRSLSLTLRQVYWSLGQLRTDYGLRSSGPILERLDELRAALADQTIEQIIVRGLHEFLDWVQIELRAIQEGIGAAFWPPPSQTQAQIVDGGDSIMVQENGSQGMTQTLGGMSQTLN
ncbi:alpha-E domain-containing protein [Lichenicoccus sp.]|uniref:alpha-E domain-containing protein n=1 Tax=Lichenicoccus sp. TaxID=2781899 RepID=UPI003D12C78A